MQLLKKQSRQIFALYNTKHTSPSFFADNFLTIFADGRRQRRMAQQRGTGIKSFSPTFRRRNLADYMRFSPTISQYIRMEKTTKKASES